LWDWVNREAVIKSKALKAMGCSERRKEIKRRRHRRKKVEYYKKRIEKANASEKMAIAEKLRELTPGADQLITTLDLEQR